LSFLSWNFDMTQQIVSSLIDTKDKRDEPASLVLHYDAAVSLAVPGYETMHTMSLACLRAYLPQQATILVVGAGTGKEIVHFGQANPDWQFLGIDPSKDMLNVARQKIASQKLGDRVTLQQGTAKDVLEETYYDAATNIMVMHFIPDEEKQKFLADISEHLRPSAPLVLTTLCVEKESADLNLLMPAIHAYWQINGLPPERIKEVVEGFNSTVSPTSEAQIVTLLKNAGFRDIVRFYTGLWVSGWLAFKA
jgi:tRNA (cmo5U34)-methyltransferase